MDANVRRVSFALFLAVTALSVAVFELVPPEFAGRNPALLGISVLLVYGAASGFLLWRSSRRELDLSRTTSVFLEGLPVGIVFLDEAGKVAYANPALSDLVLSGPKDPAIGRRVAEFVHPDDRTTLAREMSRRKAGVSSTYQVRVRTRERGDRQVVVTAIPFMREGSFDGTLAVIADITPVVEARKQAEKYRGLSSFALDTVTHDLSNALAEVSGRAAMVAMAKGAATEADHAMAGALAGAAERATNLVREVKQIATAEREAWPMRPQYLGAITERALELAVLPSGVAATVELKDPASTASVAANDLAPVMISKLIEEAAGGDGRAGATAGGGPEILGTMAGGAVRLRVRGYARPVSASDLARMTAPPGPVAGEDTPWRQGLRLGLAAAIARAHGWEFVAEPPQGGGPGADFVLTVPVVAGGRG